MMRIAPSLVLASLMACNPDPGGKAATAKDAGDTASDDSGGDSGGDTGPEDTAHDTGPAPETRMLSSANLIFEGVNVGDRAGRYVAAAGDVDGDGRPDLYIGSDQGDGGEVELPGRVYVVTAASLPSAGTVQLADAPYIYMGEENGDMAGHSGGHAGDMDGDGFEEVVVSAYHASDEGIEQGRIYIMRGGSPKGGITYLADADWTFGGRIDYGRIGHGLSGVGDADGDGLADVVVGECCGEPAQRGAAWMVLGSKLGPTGIVTQIADVLPRWDGAVEGDGAGIKAAPAGDVDGDGLADSLIGARLSTGKVSGGRVYLLQGSQVFGDTASQLSSIGQQFEGTENFGELGYSIGTAGDVDGDGLGDILLGAYHASSRAPAAGAVYLFLARDLTFSSVDVDEAWLTLNSGEENEQLGVSLTGGMDVDGDDRGDFVAGASGVAPPTLEGSGEGENMDSPGDAYLFLGAYLESGVVDVGTAKVHFEGDTVNEHAGVSVASPGDVDGDGADDLLVGGERGQEGIGRAWLFYGL